MRARAKLFGASVRRAVAAVRLASLEHEPHHPQRAHVPSLLGQVERRLRGRGER